MFDWCPWLHPLTCSSVGGTQQIPHSAVSYLCAVTCLAADWHGWCPWSLLRSWTLCPLAGVIWAEWLAILETTVCTGFADTGQLCGCLANSHMTPCGGPSISIGYRKWETIKHLTRFQIMGGDFVLTEQKPTSSYVIAWTEDLMMGRQLDVPIQSYAHLSLGWVKWIFPPVVASHLFHSSRKGDRVGIWYFTVRLEKTLCYDHEGLESRSLSHRVGFIEMFYDHISAHSLLSKLGRLSHRDRELDTNILFLCDLLKIGTRIFSLWNICHEEIRK